MKYILFIIFIIYGFIAGAQSYAGYMDKMARDAGIKQPVAPKFAFKSVRVPVKADSISLVNFHSKYIKMMQAGMCF